MSYKGKKILGIIPARGGSKGISGKNLIDLAGKPLIQYVCEAARKTQYFDKVILSSDDDKIINFVRSQGIEVPFKRPDELATDTSPVIETIKHAINYFKQNNEQYDFVALLQPTCPLAVSTDYDMAVIKGVENDADTVVSVYKCGQEHPAIMYTLDETGKAEWFVKNLGWNRMARRQDLPEVYMRSGIVYLFKIDSLMNNNSLYGDIIYALEVPQERAYDINTALDLAVVEKVLDMNNI